MRSIVCLIQGEKSIGAAISEARRITLEALQSVCTYRQWFAHAVHVRTTHVHAVIGGDTVAERMLSDFKAYATRSLRRAFPDTQRRRYWAHHGSTRYLWNEVCLKAAIEYVLNGQGERMAHYPEARTRSLTLPAQFQR